MRLPRAAIVLVLFVSLIVPTAGQRAPHPADGHPLAPPAFDARQAGERVAPDVAAALAAARSPRAMAARAAELAALRRQVAGLGLSEDPYLGTPQFVVSTRQLLTPAVDGPFSAQGVARAFVDRHPALFELAGPEWDATRVTRDFVTRHNGAQHLTLRQNVAGLDVWGAELRASVTASGELITISSTLVPGLDAGFRRPRIAVSARRALGLAADDVGLALTAPLASAGRAVGASRRQTWQAGDDFRRDTPVSTELVLFPRTRLSIRPAWHVVVPEPGVGNTYDVLVDASDGAILQRSNRLKYLGGTEAASYNVFTSDSPAPGSPGTPAPIGFQFPEVPRTLVSLGPTPESPGGWLPDGVNETLGNNCDAHLDLDADNLPDLPRPQGSPYRVFDFPFDTADEPAAYRDASVAQMFYLMNQAHDRLYQLGFDEAAGNFQLDNFGQGGSGGDPVGADCQDGSGTNNANWSGTDGTSTRIQMFLFDSPVPQRDSSFDAEIAFHEYAHGLSTRLIGNNLFATQSGGLGEGWSDFFGLCLNAEPGDDPDGVYAFSAYITKDHFGTGNDNYYWGIRRYPYTTDQGKSPLTFADADPNQAELPAGIPYNTWPGGVSADEVHNVGELWCQALMDCRARLWNAGLDFAANELMMQLVVDGMKLMAADPTLLQARDAILAADVASNGGAHLAILWSGFAGRGMGASAVDTFAFTTSGIVEAFDTPELMSFTYAQGTPEQLLPGQSTILPVELAGLLGNAPLAGTAQVHTSINGAPFAATPLASTGGDAYEIVLPAVDCLDEVAWYVSVDSLAGVVTSPAGAPGDSFNSTAFTSATVFLDDDFELSSGWTSGAPGDDATAGIWVRGDPNGTDAQPEDDHTEPGSDCWFTGQGAVGAPTVNADVDGGRTTLLSPLVDLSSGDARVSYWRWYSNVEGANPGADVFSVDVSNDGGSSWFPVETVGPSGPETQGGWVFHEFNVSDVVPPTGSVRLRFVASDEGGPSVVEAAVDDVRIRRLECGPWDHETGADAGVAGIAGVPQLTMSGPLTPGTLLTLGLTDGASLALTFVWFSFSSTPTSFLGGTLYTVPIDVEVIAFTDGAGALGGSALFPGAPAGQEIWVQVGIFDAAAPFGGSLSNAVVGSVP